MDGLSFLIIKFFLTLFVIVLIPVYWKVHGLKNFLWLSDVALFLTVLALWFNSQILMSALIIGVLPFEIMWNVDFFFRLITGSNLMGITGYMFDSKFSIFVRSLSLFHVFVPLIWIWSVFYWGYDKHALLLSIAIIWAVFILSYFFTDPEENINWVYLPLALKWSWLPSYIWLIILMIGVPLLIVWPLHMLLKYVLNTG